MSFCFRNFDTFYFTNHLLNKIHYFIMKTFYNRKNHAFLFFLLIATPPSVFGQTIYRVNVNTPCTSGCNGSTWALAFPNVSTAVSTIPSGEIWVATGTYKPGTDRLNSFDLKSNIALYGGFNATESSRDDRNYTANPTILSGDMNGNDVGTTNNGENNYHVVTSYAKTGIVVDGFTIKGGNANVSATNDGGGFYCVASQATIRNCIFEYNYAEYGGGLDVTIGPSSSTSTTTTVTVSNCIFRNNRGTYGPTLAFHAYIGITNGTVQNCLFENNSGNYGGAIWESNGGTGSVGNMNNTIRDCIFKNNYGQYGGVIYATNASGSTLQNTVVNCEFMSNSATYGGAINAQNSNSFTNCLFAKNSATYGGAVNDGTNNTFTNCTFSGNTATYGNCFRNAAATTTLTNCILWNQTTPIDNAAAVVNYCDVVGGWSTGTGNLNLDPQFTSTASDNYRLATASPCRNVGSNAANAETTDLEGYTRVVGGTIDMGAYEGPSNSIGILVTGAAFATAIRSVCPTCIDGLNYLTTIAASQTSLNVSSRSITDLTGIDGFSSLTTLNVSSNNLTSLPDLPNSITNLTLSSNLLTDLPNLPSGLTQLRIDNNSITCLPTLPNTLSTFVYDAADVSCLPNIPTALTTTLPVCALITLNTPTSANSVCSGSVSLTASAAASSAMTVKWQRKGASESVFSDVVAATTYTSNATAAYAFTPNSSDNGAYYRAVFTPMCAGTGTTATQVFTTDVTTNTTNSSLNFDGLNDCVSIENCSGSAFAFSDALTIEYWFKGSNMQSAVRFQPDASTYIVMGWSNSKHIISTSGGTSGVNIGTGATDGNWHHVAMTWQKNTSLGFISYLDGVRIQRISAANTSLPSMTSGLFLGANQGTSEFMNGSIDEVRVWNVVRTQSQIQTNACNLSLPQTGLLMYYKFNHGTPDGTHTSAAIANAVQSSTYRGSLSNFNLSGTTSNFSSNIPTTCPATVLPVELLAFEGKNRGGGNKLTWQTANEINTQLFDIQRLTANNSFETIGQIKAFNKPSTYSFTDKNPLVGINYYRLKIVDFDEKSEFSKTISLQNDNILRGPRVYPNPVSDILTIENADGKTIEIINTLGQIVLTQNTFVPNINVQSLANGIYFLKIGSDLVRFVKN